MKSRTSSSRGRLRKDYSRSALPDALPNKHLYANSEQMKVSIIGGGGLVGSSAAFALQCGGVVREIALLDLNQDLASGQALDVLHGSPSTADQIISCGSYEHVPDSDVICITAGLRRKPDESRLD